MGKCFHLCNCSEFDDFTRKVQKLLPKDKNEEDRWIFRGQKDAKWTLETSLDRACERFRVTGEKKSEVERRMIREFQRRLHHYIANVPANDNVDEWMALIQHYFAPTRLLDFTYSPYVAAYFAFENSEPSGKVSIWAINTDWCGRQLKERSQSLADEYYKYQRSRIPQSFKELFMSSVPNKIVLSINPFRLNERLAYPRGAFLCPGDSTCTFMDNLREFIDGSDLNKKVIKFTIPTGDKGDIRNYALQQLDYMNINRITLFPGLEGFAKSFAPRIDSLFLRQR